ncbi:fec operon regulator FecR [Pigmentiphaga humi]|uniref:Fec operon regulator FecR n=1 Tax=Pigmentiphaga humi TaxID=2478468 RepID=A0A3P4B486_9BURK|nr:FecR family protein [Pigmentiphaga humi]VCU71099.1 fec operon regulator FecR [Pigmentiphaga humi]
MTLDDPNSSNDLRKDAVRWLTRMHSGEATREEVDACAAWRRADPEHERMYRSVEFFWQASGHLPEKKWRAILAREENASPKPRSFSRREFGWGLAGACAAALAAVAVPQLRPSRLEYQHTASTRPGERRDIALPDGSVLNLNVDTHLEVAFYESQRVVALTRGEAFFSVKSDPGRAFLVKAGDTVVKVTGTRFNVRHDAGGVRVGVKSGSVNVSAGPWWDKSRRDLIAGQTVAIGADEQVSEVATASIANLTAWREGKIVFDNAPLAQVVEEMSRYLPRPIRLDAPHLRDFRVAGVFNIDNPQSMMMALPAIAPVRLSQLSDGRVSVRAR